MRCERHKEGWLIETAESLGSFVFILCRGENCVFEAKEEKLILEIIFFVCFYCSLEFFFFFNSWISVRSCAEDSVENERCVMYI